MAWAPIHRLRVALLTTPNHEGADFGDGAQPLQSIIPEAFGEVLILWDWNLTDLTVWTDLSV
jgi:hypothetical protein